MALEGYVKIKGTAQGPFKGNSVKTVRKDWIAVRDYSALVTSARDTASGLPIGKHLYQPIQVVTAAGAHTAQVLQALEKNENLSSVIFEWEEPNAAGSQLVTFFRVTLTNANVISHELGTDAVSPTVEILLSTFGLTFEKILTESLTGAISTSDFWVPPGGP